MDMTPKYAIDLPSDVKVTKHYHPGLKTDFWSVSNGCIYLPLGYTKEPQRNVPVRLPTGEFVEVCGDVRSFIHELTMQKADPAYHKKCLEKSKLRESRRLKHEAQRQGLMEQYPFAFPTVSDPKLYRIEETEGLFRVTNKRKGCIQAFCAQSKLVRFYMALSESETQRAIDKEIEKCSYSPEEKIKPSYVSTPTSTDWAKSYFESLGSKDRGSASDWRQAAMYDSSGENSKSTSKIWGPAPAPAVALSHALQKQRSMMESPKKPILSHEEIGDLVDQSMDSARTRWAAFLDKHWAKKAIAIICRKNYRTLRQMMV